MNFLFMTAAVSFFHIVNVPVATLREMPQEDAEIVSQAYYSEAVLPLEESNEWAKVQTAADHYAGWVKKSAFIQKDAPYPDSQSEKQIKINRLQAHLYAKADTVFGPLMTLPFDSRLEVAELDLDLNSRWIKVKLVDGTFGYIQRGDISFDLSSIDKSQIAEFSRQFLNLPYTWGGRSSFGYDCSGFTQMLYRQMGIFLPRDAKDQVKWEGFTPVSLDNLQVGDLIYFGESESAIKHTALFIGSNSFIHPSVRENRPYLRINSLGDPEWSGSGYYKYRTARTLK